MEEPPSLCPTPRGQCQRPLEPTRDVLPGPDPRGGQQCALGLKFSARGGDPVTPENPDSEPPAPKRGSLSGTDEQVRTLRGWGRPRQKTGTLSSKESSNPGQRADLTQPSATPTDCSPSRVPRTASPVPSPSCPHGGGAVGVRRLPG